MSSWWNAYSRLCFYFKKWFTTCEQLSSHTSVIAFTAFPKAFMIPGAVSYNCLLVSNSKTLLSRTILSNCYSCIFLIKLMAKLSNCGLSSTNACVMSSSFYISSSQINWSENFLNWVSVCRFDDIIGYSSMSFISLLSGAGSVERGIKVGDNLQSGITVTVHFLTGERGRPEAP